MQSKVYIMLVSLVRYGRTYVDVNPLSLYGKNGEDIFK